jgi:hypothetical protein
MQEQFEKLILKPLQNLEQSDVSVQTMIIVLNALDECEGDSDIRLILQLLPRLQNIAAIRLQVLLTSRPIYRSVLDFRRSRAMIMRTWFSTTFPWN